MRDASSWDRNRLTLSYPRAIVILSFSEGIFCEYTFYIYVTGYLECTIHEKSYYISAYVASGKFLTTVLHPQFGEHIVIHRLFRCIPTLQCG